MSEFIHLHNHSHYSLLDAISSVDGLVEAASKNNMHAVALTDHGVMYGALEFYKKAVSKNIKPIIGVEAYVAQTGSRHDRGKKENIQDNGNGYESGTIEDGLSSSDINYAHLILLAKNERGYKNLIKLVSLGHTEGFYYKPRIDLEILNKYREGLIALSACGAGVISTYICRDDMATARKMTGVYKEIFGEDFYLEIQNHLTLDFEKKILKTMPKLAKEFGLKLIATNDVHYIKKEHSIAHNIYLYISAKKGRNANPDEVTTNLRYGTDQIYFKTSYEMCDLFKDFPEAIKSTLEVTEKCEIKLDLGTHYMPEFPIPKESKAKDLDEYLEQVTFEGMKSRFKKIMPEIEERIKYELGVIKNMKFSGYFLIVKDFIDTARKKNILVGPGRGSAAGSIVCYCLGITNVNPLEYNLLFERFLNPDRISMPDIDVDFQDDRRDEIIQYAKEKYGENSVAQIVTFNKLAPRGVLKDVGRVLNFPYQDINELTKYIPSIFGKIKSLSECMKEVPEFKKFFETGNENEKINKKSLYEYSMVLENLNRNASIHASGIVITPSQVTDYVPLSKATNEDNVFCTQYDMNLLEDAGLIKIDFLGLKELKVISRTLSLINTRYRTDLTTDKIPLDDKKTYDLFSSGATVGVFQFSKSKMREYLAKLKPRNINDLAAMNALYRPGPMKLIPEFIEKRFGRKKIEYLHPLMENALRETYGIIVYQEQVMQIARELAGFTMAQADNMRKAIGKKIKTKMKQAESDFIKGATGNNIDKKTVKQIYDLILSFADYGFNKSHGVAYSILAYYTAYLKAHYPIEFLTVSLECRKDNETEMQQLADECKKMKIKLRPPDVNSSFFDFRIRYDDKDIKNSEIFFGLSAIKNVGEKASKSIIEEREKNGNYRSFIDFLKRVDLRLINKKTIEGLIYSGAFDSIDSNRKKLLLNLERAVLHVQRYKESPLSRGQEFIFGGANSGGKEDDLPLLEYDDFSESERFSYEKSIIGYYLTGHPLEKYRDEIEKFINFNFGEDVSETEFDKLGTVRMCGVISNVQVKISRNNNRFVIFNLIDFQGSGECIAFKNLYESKSYLFKNDSLVFVEGKAEENGDKIRLTVDNLYPIEGYHQRLANNLIIDIYENRIDVSKLDTLKDYLEDNTGNCHLFFNIINGNDYRIFRAKNRINPTGELISNLKKLFGENNLRFN